MTAKLDLRPGEIDALRWPEDLTVSQWAEQNRILDLMSSGFPGPWSNDLTPWLTGIMDAWTDRDVGEITVMKAAQMGVTEAALNILGFTIDQDPGPLMYVMPRRTDREYLSKRRFEPMIEETPALQLQLTGRRGDEKAHERAFRRMLVYFSSAESPSDMSSRPCRYVIFDETDRYPQWSGREGDPIELGRGRTARFWNRKILKLSTPTLEGGYIYQEWKRSDRRRFWIPCQKCGGWQHLVFEQIKLIGTDRDPARIRNEKRARYECRHCQAEISEVDKARACRVGVWVQENARITPAGQVKDERPAPHRGFHLNALYWTPPWEVLAAFFEAKDEGPQKLMPFVNQILGDVWREKVRETTVDQLERLALPYERGTVPGGVHLVTAGVDVQMDHFYYVVRGWGLDLESWLIEADTVNTWDQLVRVVLRKQFGGHLIDKVAIDSGFRTWEVYEACMTWSGVAVPVKGDNRPTSGLPFRVATIEKHPVSGQSIPGGLRLWHVNTGLFKDRIARLQQTEEGQPGGWHLHAEPSPVYLDQLVNERRSLEVDKGGRSRWVWKKRYQQAPNHYWDCEVYAAAAAHMLGAHTLKADLVEAEKAKRKKRRASTGSPGESRGRGRGEFGDWADGYVR